MHETAAAPAGVAPAAINDRREIFGWTMYDWAISAFSTTVVTVLAGPYLVSLARADVGAGGTVLSLGPYNVTADSLFPFCVSASVFLQVFLLPILGAVADYTHLNKRLMIAFTYIGAVATALLFFIVGDLYLLGGLLFIIANLVAGAIYVLYNATLCQITTEDQRDRVSSRGFALVTFARLRVRGAARELPPGSNVLTIGFVELGRSFRELARLPQTLRFLIGYMLFNDGIQTVISLASVFLINELYIAKGRPEEDGQSFIILTILLVQFVAFFGALAFGRIAGYVGAKRAIILSLVIWSGVVIYAYGFLQTNSQALAMAAVIAVVLGGSQALSRSLFSRMIPAGREASFFGIYEISERGTSWIGPLIFGIVVGATGSYRQALLSLIVLFLLGLVILALTDTDRAIHEAGNATPEEAAAARAGAGI